VMANQVHWGASLRPGPRAVSAARSHCQSRVARAKYRPRKDAAVGLGPDGAGESALLARHHRRKRCWRI
jgi:hypothetical protein